MRVICYSATRKEGRTFSAYSERHWRWHYMALKLKVEKTIHQTDVHWVARLFADGKHVGTLEFDEIELVGKDLVLHEKDKEE